MWATLFRNKSLLAVLAGACAILAFPMLEAVPLALLYPIFTLLLLRECKSVRAAFGYGFLSSFVVMLIGFYWVIYVIHEFGYLPWTVAVLLFLGFCGFGALNFPFFTTVLKFIHNRFNIDDLPTPWIEIWFGFGIPGLYALVEYFTPKLFPWFLGHCLYRMPLLNQIVEITGSIFLSFALVSIGSVAALYVLRRLEGKLNPHPGIWAIPVTVWVIIITFSAVQLSKPLPDRLLRVALIQANIGNLEKVAARKGFVDKVRHVIATYVRLTDEAVKNNPKLDLILWPETAMPFTFQNENNIYTQEIRQKVLGWKVPLITGGYAVSPFDFNRDYNSGYLLEPMGNDKIHQEMYHKNELLAFGEYMPLGTTFPILYKWFPQVSDFERGKIQNAFTLKDGLRLGMTICYEVIDPNFFRKVAMNEVNAVVNLTNDSWFGPTSEPYLHGAITVFRSIESRIPLMRVTNTGTSFVVDVNGRLSEQTGVYTEGILYSEVHLPEKPPLTFYTKHGDWFIVFLVISELGLLLILRKRHAPLPV